MARLSQRDKKKYLRAALRRGLKGPLPWDQITRGVSFSAEEKKSLDLFYTFRLRFEDGSVLILPPVSSKLKENKKKTQLDKILRYVTRDYSFSQSQYSDDLACVTYVTENWPVLVAEGGYIVPFLTNAGEKSLNLTSQVLISQLLGDISRDTTTRLSEQASDLLCDHCFVRYMSYESTLSWIKTKIIYYGCRHCGRSREFIKHKSKVIAVLDSQMKEKYQARKNVLRVNWLSHRRIFDFDQIEIVRATDEDVERLAVQIGNDTDSIRRAQHKKLPYRIDTSCKLSKNTMRILQHILRK